VKDKLNIHEVILSDIKYEKILANITDYIFKEDFTNRHNTIRVLVGKSKIKLKYSQLLINLIMLKVFNVFKVKPTIDYIFQETATSENISKYYDNVIEKFRALQCDFTLLCSAISDSVQQLAHLAGEMNYRVGNTISIYNIIQSGLKNPEVFDIINTKIPPDLEFHEIEEYITARQKRLIELFRNDPDSILYNYFNSGSGINPKQFAEIFVSLGLSADLYGNIIPEPVDTNIIRGFRNVKDFYINAISARKALILTHQNVKESGYLTRKLSLLMIDSWMDYEKTSCNSVQYLTVKVDDIKTLQRIEGRWFYNSESLTEEIITKNSTDLIGRTIKLRSPITCNGDKVCRKCYGDDLAKLNKDLHTGILAVLLLTNKLTQRLLSAKHLLSTKSKKINWPAEFKKCYALDKNFICLKKKAVKDSCKLLVKMEKETTDSKEVYYKVNEFFCKSSDCSMTVNPGVSFIPTEEFLLYIKNLTVDKENIYTIKCSDICNMNLFYTNVANTELSHVVKRILKLIESSDHLELGDDIIEIYNTFIKLLNDSNFDIMSVHIEMILRELMRDASNIIFRPDMSFKNLQPYKVLRVSDGITNSKSVSASLVFERIKNQLMKISTYEKEGYSIIDELIK
jgi:hypothetical protein